MNEPIDSVALAAAAGTNVELTGGIADFLRLGTLVLPSLVASETVEQLRASFFATYARYLAEQAHPDALRVGDRRYMITTDLVGPFADPAAFAPPVVLDLMRSLLTTECVIGSVGVVLSLPGAAAQHVHRDFAIELFPGSGLDPILPPYAITLVVPLVDVDPVIGTTLVWPGSHRQRRAQNDYAIDEAVWPRLKAGDGLLMDYRLVHGGSANHSSLPRPILYIVYCRPWFRDHVNYRIQPRLRLDPDALASMQAEHRALFADSGG
ncbi:MAG: phytanoyl-CoA dioxygenase family protein [Pseudomarimonas sp.]